MKPKPNAEPTDAIPRWLWEHARAALDVARDLRKVGPFAFKSQAAERRYRAFCRADDRLFAKARADERRGKLRRVK